MELLRTLKLEYEEPPAGDKTPEINLLTAMVEQSVVDCIYPLVHHGTTAQTKYRNQDRQNARAWIFSDSHRPFSFLWVLEYLVEDYSDFAKKIRQFCLSKERQDGNYK